MSSVPWKTVHKQSLDCYKRNSWCVHYTLCLLLFTVLLRLTRKIFKFNRASWTFDVRVRRHPCWTYPYHSKKFYSFTKTLLLSMRSLWFGQVIFISIIHVVWFDITIFTITLIASFVCIIREIVFSFLKLNNSKLDDFVWKISSWHKLNQCWWKIYVCEHFQMLPIYYIEKQQHNFDTSILKTVLNIMSLA